MGKYEILGCHWFTPMAPIMPVGVVATACGPNKKNWKGYIGLAVGKDEGLDQQFIANYGAKIFDKAQAAAFFPDLNIEDFVV